MRLCGWHQANSGSVFWLKIDVITGVLNVFLHPWKVLRRIERDEFSYGKKHVQGTFASSPIADLYIYIVYIYIYTVISTPNVDANKEMKKTWSHFSSKWWNFHHSRYIRPQWEIYFKPLRGLLGHHTMSSIVGCTLTAWFKPRSALSSGVILMAFKFLLTICPIQKYTITTLSLKKWAFFRKHKFPFFGG